MVNRVRYAAHSVLAAAVVIGAVAIPQIWNSRLTTVVHSTAPAVTVSSSPTPNERSEPFATSGEPAGVAFVNDEPRDADAPSQVALAESPTAQPSPSPTNSPANLAARRPSGPIVALKRTEYLPMFEAAAAKYEVPLEILLAVGQIESGFYPYAVGPYLPQFAGTKDENALGMMQFLPSTFELYKQAAGSANPDIFDPRDSVFAAAAYLADSGVKKDPVKALHAYNNSYEYVYDVLTLAETHAKTPERVQLFRVAALGARPKLPDPGQRAEATKVAGTGANGNATAGTTAPGLGAGPGNQAAASQNAAPAEPTATPVPPTPTPTSTPTPLPAVPYAPAAPTQPPAPTAVPTNTPAPAPPAAPAPAAPLPNLPYSPAAPR